MGYMEFEDCFDDVFEDDCEPIGSCWNCDSDIFDEEDDGSGLCDRCQWLRDKTREESRDGKAE